MEERGCVCPLCGATHPTRWRFDRSSGSIETPEGSAHLRPMESNVFAVLAEKPGAIVSKERLISRAWGLDEPEFVDQALSVHLCKIRRKVTPIGLGIRNETRRGYALVGFGAVPR